MPTRARKVELPSVDAFLAALDHPRMADIRALRALILTAHPSIGESVKWNAPSFFTTEHFATMRLHGKPPLQLILHLGTSRQTLPHDAIDDPHGLLKWLGADRACVDFAEAGAVDRHRDALQSILRQWLPHVPAAAR